MSIELQEVSRVYRLGKTEIRALRNLSLTIDPHSFVAIVGPSGCGKSTLLNQIGGIDKPNVGTICVDGVDLTQMAHAALVEYRLKKVGFVFQFNNLATALTAADNVELPLIFLGKPRQERKHRVKELLKILGLEDRSSHRPDSLSGGERQRLAIAIALANDPPILLADEPTGELDSENTLNICKIFSNLNQDYGKTIVLITHDPSVAAFAQRIVQLKDGQLMGVRSSKEFSESLNTPEISEEIPKALKVQVCHHCGSSKDFKLQKVDQTGLWVEYKQNKHLLSLTVLECTQCDQLSFLADKIE
ncbi:MAG: ABC transporter ATP-binding protein [Candidatus Hodarchaeota archaeon]